MARGGGESGNEGESGGGGWEIEWHGQGSSCQARKAQLGGGDIGEETRSLNWLTVQGGGTVDTGGTANKVAQEPDEATGKEEEGEERSDRSGEVTGWGTLTRAA